MKTLKIAVISAITLFVSLSFVTKAQEIPDPDIADATSKMLISVMTTIMNADSNATDAEKGQLVLQTIENMGKDAIAKIDDLERRRIMQGMMDEAKNYPETFFDAQNAFIENALYIYPNPSDGNNVTLEIYTHNWKFHFAPEKITKADIKLFCNGNEVAKLVYNNIQDNKVIIDKKYLTQKGTYTVSFDGGSTSFIVR